MDLKGIGVVLLVLFGGIFGGIGTVHVLDHNLSVQEHQPTEATVQSLDVEVDPADDEDDEDEYRPDITYTYEVDGRTYESDNVFPGDFRRWSTDRGWAVNITGHYEVGGQVTVYYDPRDPGQAYLQNDDGKPDGWLMGTGYTLVAAVTGIWLVRTGFRRRRQRVLMRDTPTESAQALSIGPSEIKGTAVTDDREALDAPFSDDDVVVAEYEVEEYDEADDEDDNSTWKTIESDLLHTPFYVDDGTGTVLVRPDDDATVELDPDDWSEIYVDSSERGPGPVREFVERTPGLGYPAHSSGKDSDRRYRQNFIRDGESVYVFGTVQPRGGADVDVGADNADRLVIRKVEDDAFREPMFLISDDTETNLKAGRQFAAWRLPVGGIFICGAFASMLLMFGPNLGLTLPVLL